MVEWRAQERIHAPTHEGVPGASAQVQRQRVDRVDRVGHARPARIGARHVIGEIGGGDPPGLGRLPWVGEHDRVRLLDAAAAVAVVLRVDAEGGI